MTLRKLAIVCALISGFGQAAALGQTIDACGQLSTRMGCILFSAEDSGTYVLNTAGGFEAGERVHVVGAVDPTCTPLCTEATACLIVSSITTCGDQFSGCGTLIRVGGCTLFQADSGATYVLSRTANFIPGDRVQINGTVNPNCLTTCAPSGGCLTVNTIVVCGAEFDACGTLVQSGVCVVFQADTGGLFNLQTRGGFAVGARVRVTGTPDMSCVTTCPSTDGCINDNTIVLCTESFDGCGTLVSEAGCVQFRADTGVPYVLGTLGTFAVGDRVHVTGVIGGTCVSPCAATVSCIAQNTIGACNSGFSECGTLVQGTECLLFQADTGASYVLDSTAGLRPGDRVRVEGTLDPNCVSICQQNDGCILNSTVSTNTLDCETNPSPVCPTTAAGLVTLAATGLLLRRGRMG